MRKNPPATSAFSLQPSAFIGLTAFDNRLLDRLQLDIPLVKKPWRALARQLNVKEPVFLERAGALKKKGVIRRISATFDPGKIGFTSTLAAAKIAPGKIDRVAAGLNACAEVTHSYKRDSEFNLWFTIVARGKKPAARILGVLGKDRDVLALIELPAVRIFKIRVNFPMAGKHSIFRRTRRAPLLASGPEKSDRPGKPKKTLTLIERKIIGAIYTDIPLVERPFENIAAALNVSENKLLAYIRAFRKKHILRKYAAVLNHRKAGFNCNAMAVWRAPAELIPSAGALMASYAAVSHCYQRQTARGWDYNLYSMIHGHSKEECLALAGKISGQTGLKKYRILFSTKEYKKTGVKY